MCIYITIPFVIQSRSWAARGARRQTLFVGVSSPCFITLPHAQCGGIVIEQLQKNHPQKILAGNSAIRRVYKSTFLNYYVRM